MKPKTEEKLLHVGYFLLKIHILVAIIFLLEIMRQFLDYTDKWTAVWALVHWGIAFASIIFWFLYCKNKHKEKIDELKNTYKIKTGKEYISEVDHEA